MKKKDYQKPTMQVVKLQHESQLLTGSGDLNPMGDPEEL